MGGFARGVLLSTASWKSPVLARWKSPPSAGLIRGWVAHLLGVDGLGAKQPSLAFCAVCQLPELEAIAQVVAEMTSMSTATTSP